MNNRILMLLVLICSLLGVSTALSQNAEELRIPLNGQYPLTEEKATLTVMVLTDPRVEDMNTNAFTLWFEELTNVHVEWLVVPAEGANEALSLTLASGDLPDVILSFNTTLSTVSIYGSQGLIIPLNDLIAEHGINTNAMFDAVPGLREQVTSPDGNIYALPRVNVCYHCSASQKMWINQAWLTALGLEMPQTTAEFRDVLIAFRDQDPNGNGIQDEIPLTGAIQSWNSDLRQFLINPFIFNNIYYGNSGLYLDNGQVRASYTTEEYREALRYLKGLVDEGLIPTEALTQTEAVLIQQGENPEGNQIGAVGAGYQGQFTQIGGESNRWLDYVTVPPLEGPNGNRVAPWEPYGLAPGSFMITSAATDPVLALKWGDAFYEWEVQTRRLYGTQGVDWDYAPEGTLGLNGEAACRISITPYGNIQNNHWYETGPEFLSAEFRLCEGYDASNSGAQLERILYDETAKNYAPYAAPSAIIVPPLSMSEENATESSELGVGIDSYVTEMFALFITGQADLDTEWETYLQTLDELGLPRYLEIRQNTFDSQYNGNWPPSN
jgi:putative aldouronate transport system substrate-binding protein